MMQCIKVSQKLGTALLPTKEMGCLGTVSLDMYGSNAVL